MRRSLLVLSATVLGVTGVAAPAGADSSSDSARGHVRLGATDVDFSARANFNGTEPSGRVRITQANSDPNVVYEGNVTCLSVAGNIATLTGDITSTRGAASTFVRSYIMTVEDSGKFSNFPDEMSLFFSSSPASDVCPAATTFTSVVDGEIVVHDG